MPIYALKTSAAWTADATPNGAVFADVADPATISGLTNGTPYQVAEILMSPLSAEFTPAVPLLPFVDDFSTDTSANWTEFSNVVSSDGDLVITGGLATQSGGSNVLVHRDVGLSTDHRVRVVCENTSSQIWLYAKWSSPIDWVAVRWNGTDELQLWTNVAGVRTVIELSNAFQFLTSGDMLELEVYNAGNSAVVRRSTTGDPADLVEVTPVGNVSSVPAGTEIGFRLETTASITEFSADNVA